jgi:antitoxin (DNA-binding transcriptional repressor) of toxin-antitoxin stability system
VTKQIDLDDLPPRIAQTLASLAEGEELVLARGGVVVARLTVAEPAAPAPGEALSDLPPDEAMKEVMEHFSAMIQDEF